VTAFSNGFNAHFLFGIILVFSHGNILWQALPRQAPAMVQDENDKRSKE
jgi:hypothetical protein